MRALSAFIMIVLLFPGLSLMIDGNIITETEIMPSVDRIFPDTLSHFVRDPGSGDLYAISHDSVVVVSGTGYLVDRKDPSLPDLSVLFAGSHPSAPVGADPNPAFFNYYKGNDPSKWIERTPAYDSVAIEGIYDDIDFRISFSDGSPKTEFVVHPGGDPLDITLDYGGAIIDSDDRFLHFIGGLIEGPLVVTQENTTIDSAYECEGDTVSFDLGRYDRSKDLIIDPLLTASTFVGANGWDQYPISDRDISGNIVFTCLSDNGPDIDIMVVGLDDDLDDLIFMTVIGGGKTEFVNGTICDRVGNVILSGFTYSQSFPTTSGVVNQTYRGGSIDGFLTVLSTSDGSMKASSYVGGLFNDRVTSLGVDSSGSIVASGFTNSLDFWTSPGSYSRTLIGGEDAFLATFTIDLKTALRCTFFGGSDFSDKPTALKVLADDSVGITGSAMSSDFPTTPGVLRRTSGSYNGFITVFKSDFSGIKVSSYMGNGSFIKSIEHRNSEFYIAGRVQSGTYPTTPDALDRSLTGTKDGFLTILPENLTMLRYSTYIGADEKENNNPDFEYDESVMDIDVSPGGTVYLTGFTDSIKFPTTLGAYDFNRNECDSFLMIITPDRKLAYSTFLGGTDEDRGYSVTLNGTKDVIIVGYSYSNSLSSDFPVTVGSYDTTFNGGYDLTITKFDLTSDVPSVPTNPSITPGDTWNELSWGPPADDGNEDVLGYYIYRNTGKTPLATVPGTHYNDTGLMKGKNYLYRIHAFNKVGKGLGVEVNGTPYSKPSAPEFTSRDMGDRWIWLSWRRPIDLGGYDSVIYKVYIKSEGNTEVQTFDGTEHRFENITNGLEHKFRISAVNPKGEGPKSLQWNLTTYGIPSEPLNFRSSSGDESLAFEWDRPLYDGGSFLTYTLTLYDRFGNPIKEADDLSVLEYNITQLRNGVAYNCSLQTNGPLGDSGIVWLYNLTPFGEISGVLNLSVVQDNETLLLKWLPPLYLGASKNVTYNVYSVDGGSPGRIASDVRDTVFRLGDIIYGKEYEFRVSAQNELFESELSEGVSIIPYDYPSTPTSVRIIVGGTYINMTWGAPSYLGGDPSPRYRVYIGTDLANLYPDSILGLEWRNFTNLRKGAIYHVAVSAWNKRGEGELCDPLNGTPRTRPDPPESLSYVQHSESIDLSWSPPKDDGGYRDLLYTVYVGTARDSMQVMVSDVSDRSLSIGDLVNGVTYYIAVAAKNGMGISEMSDVLEAVPITYPSAPVIRNLTSGDGWIELSWDPPSDDGGSDIWLYHIYLGQNWSKPYKSVAPTVRSYRIEGLENGKVYTVSVSCENSLGEGPRSDSKELTPGKKISEKSDTSIIVIVAACALVILLLIGISLYMHSRSVKRERFLEMYRQRKIREIRSASEKPEE